MKYLTEELHDQGFREYGRDTCVVFLKTHEAFGGLSNMAAGYPLIINDVPIRTSEALYQACRFPDRPDIQTQIVQQASPMTAKMVGKPFRLLTRPDWNHARKQIMRWCLRVKLIQNWEAFSHLLLSTGDRPIVEQSRKDDYWGAKAVDDFTLVGRNVLGRLLMELREDVRERAMPLQELAPPEIPNFQLFGHVVCTIVAPQKQVTHLVAESSPPTYQATAVQTKIWDIPGSTEPARPRVPIEPYPVYKVSGVAWIGRVPEHWAALPHRTIFKEVIERDHPNEDMLSVTIRSGVIPQTELLAGSSMKDSSNIDRSSYKLVQPGDVVYNKMRAWQGAIGVSRYQGIVSPAYIVERFRDYQVPEYFHYLYRIPAFATEAERWSYGITSDQWSLRSEDFKQIYSCVPPLDEQAAIVKYLAHVDRKIDRFIRSKQRMIELLNEQKQAIIHQAVTKGLDPSAPMKDSGVEWLGEIPAHWELAQFGRVISTIEQGWSPNSSGHDVDPDSPAVLTLSAVKRGTFDPQARKPLEEIPAGKTHLAVRGGDFLLTRANTRTLVGDVAIVESSEPNLLLCDLIYLLSLNNQLVTSSFLKWLLLSRVGRAQIERDARGSNETMVKISHSLIRSWVVVLPPVKEQHEIVDSLERESRRHDQAMARLEHEIALTREYRNRLVSDVVTGKLDVREAAVATSGLSTECTYAVASFAEPPDLVDIEFIEDELPDE